MKLIKSLDELKELCKDSEVASCCIVLQGGARSSKQVQHWPTGFTGYVEDFDNIEEGFPQAVQWGVTNEIDESEMGYVNDDDLETSTHIVEAISRGAFYCYDRS